MIELELNLLTEILSRWKYNTHTIHVEQINEVIKRNQIFIKHAGNKSTEKCDDFSLPQSH